MCHAFAACNAATLSTAGCGFLDLLVRFSSGGLDLRKGRRGGQSFWCGTPARHYCYWGYNRRTMEGTLPSRWGGPMRLFGGSAKSGAKSGDRRGRQGIAPPLDTVSY